MSWLRAWYGETFLVAVSEHWEKHETLPVLLDWIGELEARSWA